MKKDDEDWKNSLTPQQYAVLRENATEPPFTGDLLYNKAKGTYTCAGCGSEIFSSDTKFDSGSGWPSFDNVIDNERLTLVTDSSHGMIRTEVRCATCDGHLGHLFDDGPRDTTGQRYCINSVALNFKEHDAA